MKMKFPDGVTHHYDEAGQRHDVVPGSFLEVPEHQVADHLAAGFTKYEAPAEAEAPQPEVAPEGDASGGEGDEAEQE